MAESAEPKDPDPLTPIDVLGFFKVYSVHGSLWKMNLPRQWKQLKSDSSKTAH